MISLILMRRTIFLHAQNPKNYFNFDYKAQQTNRPLVIHCFRWLTINTRKKIHFISSNLQSSVSNLKIPLSLGASVDNSNITKYFDSTHGISSRCNILNMQKLPLNSDFARTWIFTFHPFVCVGPLWSEWTKNHLCCNFTSCDFWHMSRCTRLKVNILFFLLSLEHRPNIGSCGISECNNLNFFPSHGKFESRIFCGREGDKTLIG